MSQSVFRKIYPASLLLDGKSCLVVGGGKIATRKVSGLLDAGAVVTVVSPVLDQRLNALAREQRISHVARPFKADDPEGNVLVFAATGSKQVNRDVLNACRSRGVWCCPVDGNWMDGDFVTPAAFRSGALSVAVSTGGQSCRRSRLIKENLARHVDMVDSADFVVIGTSHQQLNLSEREPFHLGETKMQTVGRLLMHVWGIHEFMLLDTCNRIELLAVKASSEGTDSLILKVLGFDQLAPDQYYVKRGYAAFEHAAFLASGLFSQMSGETHIVSQLKQALAFSGAEGWSGGLVEEWVTSALHISKHIRSHLPSDLARGEIEDAAVRFLEYKRMDGECRVAVLGTGTVGEGMVTRLSQQGIPCQWFYHRQRPEADLVPKGVMLSPWSCLSADLMRANVIIVTTSSPIPVLTAAEGPYLSPDDTLLLMDLSTPRNVDPELVNSRSGIELADLDTLKAFSNSSSPVLEPLLQSSAAIVKDHESMFYSMLRNFQA